MHSSDRALEIIKEENADHIILEPSVRHFIWGKKGSTFTMNPCIGKTVFDKVLKAHDPEDIMEIYKEVYISKMIPQKMI